MIITKKGILDLAERLAGEYPNNLKYPKELVLHLGGSYDNAERVCNAIKEDEDLERLRPLIIVAAGLHDIGRFLKKDQKFHELRSAQYILQHGYDGGIADDSATASIIANMAGSHFIVYEQALLEQQTVKEEFGVTDLISLLPNSLGAKIVVYSELTDQKGRNIPF